MFLNKFLFGYFIRFVSFFFLSNSIKLNILITHIIVILLAFTLNMSVLINYLHFISSIDGYSVQQMSKGNNKKSCLC